MVEFKKVIKDIENQVKPYHPTGKNPCNCVKHLTLAGHGAPGALYLGSLIVRTDLIDTWKKTKQMLIERGIDQNGRFPEVEFFNAVGKYLCKNATVRFVTCNSGEGVEGEKLRKWLQEQLGPNANIKLYEDAVMYIFGVPVHCKKNEMKN